MMLKSMRSINRFSFSRSLRLVGMDLRMSYQKLLIFSGALFAVMVVFPMITGYSKINYELREDAGSIFIPIFLGVMVAYLFYFHYMMNKRIRESDTIAYSSIPSSTEERFLSILILGGIYFFLAWVVAQISMSSLILINPTTISAKTSFLVNEDFISVVGGTAFYSPKVFFIAISHLPLLVLFLIYILYFAISQKSLWGWSSTTWWEKIVVIGLVVFVSFTLTRESQDLKPVYEVVYWVIAVALFVASYFRLKFIEQL